MDIPFDYRGVPYHLDLCCGAVVLYRGEGAKSKTLSSGVVVRGAVQGTFTVEWRSIYHSRSHNTVCDLAEMALQDQLRQVS